MTYAPPYRSPILADAVLGSPTLLKNAALVLGGAGLTGLAAQVAVPLWPVPITGQTLAVLIVGAALGALRGGLSLLVYAILGCLGVPWFSAASSGWTVLLGPTGGYIIGFIFAAALAGSFAQHSWDRRPVRALLGFAAASAIPFVIGLPWLAVVLHLNAIQTMQAGLFPFIVGGFIKALLAAAILPALWRLVPPRRR